MSSFTACVHTDILMRPPPWWASTLIAEIRGAETCLKLLTTPAQQFQLGRQACGGAGNNARRSWTRTVCVSTATDTLEAEVILTHGRRLKRVSLHRGDVELHVDLSEFLSCRGTALTEVAEKVKLLAECTQKNSYTSPFWLTQMQLEGHFHNPNIRLSTRCSPGNSSRISEVYGNPNKLIELNCGSAATARFANLDEFRNQPHLEPCLHSCLSFFRIFSPINVKTCLRFDECVERYLRVECQRSGCWCSVWGTPEDYTSCGFSTLDGAIGVHVFDGLGNPSFLIRALCTTSPLDIYARCYPHDSIFESDTC
ncbi:hypothetical protein JKF63_08000 [Porcisia hertigi]|uniref:Trypanosoma Tc-38 (p38) protein domain-containing protein n=1 Tax=Porcisia hertigi TaxID=2761500 RepID=A0A836HGB8_9TRYP|nr:hypothetical protein JKF63_08000 [Porcisia hertigi]